MNEFKGRHFRGEIVLWNGAWSAELAGNGADRTEFVAEPLGWDVELELGGAMVLRLRRARSC